MLKVEQAKKDITILSKNLIERAILEIGENMMPQVMNIIISYVDNYIPNIPIVKSAIIDIIQTRLKEVCKTNINNLAEAASDCINDLFKGYLGLSTDTDLSDPDTKDLVEYLNNLEKAIKENKITTEDYEDNVKNKIKFIEISHKHEYKKMATIFSILLTSEIHFNKIGNKKFDGIYKYLKGKNNLDAVESIYDECYNAKESLKHDVLSYKEGQHFYLLSWPRSSDYSEKIKVIENLVKETDNIKGIDVIDKLLELAKNYKKVIEEKKIQSTTFFEIINKFIEKLENINSKISVKNDPMLAKFLEEYNTNIIKPASDTFGNLIDDAVKKGINCLNYYYNAEPTQNHSIDSEVSPNNELNKNPAPKIELKNPNADIQVSSQELQPSSKPEHVLLKPLYNNSSQNNQFQPTKHKWEELMEEGNNYFSQGKTKYSFNDKENACTFFNNAKSKYKEALSILEINDYNKKLANKRVGKLKEPEGKYCLTNLKK